MTQTPTAQLPKVLTYDEFQEQQAARAAEAEATIRQQQRANYEAQYFLAFEPAYYARLAPVALPAAAAAAAPIPEPVDELTDHNYDGIQEYDNPTPGWWYLVFGGTIAFSVLYIFVYHLSTLVPPLTERHASIEAKALERRFAELNTLPNGEEKLLAIMSREEWLGRGESIFQSSCALCHQADGSGNIGPNLTDELYRNVTVLADIPGLISEGIGNGAMPAQKNLMNENEIALVSAYVASLRGTNLPTGDAVNPDYTGQPIAPWPTFGTTSMPAAPTPTATDVSFND